MKILFVLFILLGSITSCGDSNNSNRNHSSKEVHRRASDALKYCKEHKLNTDLCILVDMSIHSGKMRLFVYDFKNDSIISSGLCLHGCCDSIRGADLTKDSPSFSNVPNSHCSSLGKYKISSRNYSNWGINVNYRLLDLDKSNSNAASRDIVLHSWNEVADDEVFPDGTPEGWGCPAISNNQMTFIDSLLKQTQDVLLWIYK